jgi:hypothetical protein
MAMRTVQKEIRSEGVRSAHLWREYRQAFALFAERARLAQAVVERTQGGSVEKDSAMREAEQALIDYRQRRDALVSALLEMPPQLNAEIPDAYLISPPRVSPHPGVGARN